MEFISHPIDPGEMPDPWIVVEEIDMVFFTHLQAMYYLMSDENLLNSASLVEQMMFVFLAQWKNWQDDFFKHIKKVETVNERKMRAWVDKHKGFVLKLAEREDSADVVALFHEILKKRDAEKGENQQT